MSHQMNIRDAIAVLVFLLNFSGIVWGAAKISSSVENLKEVTLDLKEANTLQVNFNNNLTGRIVALETEIKNLKEKK